MLILYALNLERYFCFNRVIKFSVGYTVHNTIRIMLVTFREDLVQDCSNSIANALQLL